MQRSLHQEVVLTPSWAMPSAALGAGRERTWLCLGEEHGSCRRLTDLSKCSALSMQKSHPAAPLPPATTPSPGILWVPSLILRQSQKTEKTHYFFILRMISLLFPVIKKAGQGTNETLHLSNIHPQVCSSLCFYSLTSKNQRLVLDTTKIR